MYVANRPQRYSEEEARQIIANVGRKALSPHSVVGDIDNGPSNWGNIVGAKALANPNGNFKIPVDSVNGIASNTIYYVNPSFAAFSLNQKNHFQALGVDFTMCSSTSCE